WSSDVCSSDLVVGLAADEDLGNAFVDVFASGYPGTGDGADPVLGEVGVAGLRRAGELVEGFASGVGAPDAVGREEDEFALVVHGDALGKGSGRQTTALSPPSMVRIWPLTKSEAVEARKTQAPVRSAGVPQRAAGVRALTQPSNFGSAARGAVRSVRM